MTDPQKFITTTAFDVMWAVLLAMAETSKELAGESYGLEMNSELYGKTSITRSLREKLKNVSFEGLTVRCSSLILAYCGPKVTDVLTGSVTDF